MIHYNILEVSRELGIHSEVIIKWIELELIKPVEIEIPSFDHEDLARMRLILKLQELHDSNHEATQIILHLVDQIHHLQAEIKNLKKK